MAVGAGVSIAAVALVTISVTGLANGLLAAGG